MLQIHYPGKRKWFGRGNGAAGRAVPPHSRLWHLIAVGIGGMESKSALMFMSITFPLPMAGSGVLVLSLSVTPVQKFLLAETISSSPLKSQQMLGKRMVGAYLVRNYDICNLFCNHDVHDLF